MVTHTHIHTHTHDNYYNRRCACAPRVNKEYNILYKGIHVYGDYSGDYSCDYKVIKEQ